MPDPMTALAFFCPWTHLLFTSIMICNPKSTSDRGHENFSRPNRNVFKGSLK